MSSDLQKPPAAGSHTRFKIGLIVLLLIPTVITLFYNVLGRPNVMSGIITMRQREPIPQVEKLDAGNWFSADFQRSVSRAFDGSFGLRPLLVRFSNQLYFDVLERSFMDSSSIIVGKQGQLYQTPYLFDYTFQRPESDFELREFVELLERAQKLLAERGQMFLYMTTPSKAVWHWETLPDFFQTHSQPGPRSYQLLKPLLAESDVHWLDAAQLTGQTSDDPRDPAFPKGGIHWSDSRAFLATQELVRMLNHDYHRELPVPVAQRIEYRNKNAKGVDADLARLLFVYFPPVDYPHTRVHPAAGEGVEGRKAVYVGSSFSEPVADYLRECDVFAAVDYYFYYRLEKNRQPFDAATIDWEHDILQADAIIVESNESALPGQHVIDFLNDLIARLEEA